MKLHGIVDNSLGGFITIRGYSDINKLYNVSEAKSYQRIIDPSHLIDLKEYYKKGEHLFFPEIILSYTFDSEDWEKIVDMEFEEQSYSENPLLTNIKAGKKFSTNNDNIKFKAYKSFPGEMYGLELIIKDDFLKNSKPFSRVDGNHRLEAHNALSESRKLYKVPYCIILFPFEQSQKKQKTIFHNINSKAKMLSSEEELSGIIGSDDFTDEELKTQFGLRYLKTREIAQECPKNILERLYPNLYKGFCTKDGKLFLYSVLFKLIDFLFDNEIMDGRTSKKSIIKALEKVNNCFTNHNKLIETNNSAFIISAVGIELENNNNVTSYTNWLAKNQIGDLEEIQPQSLYNIYHKLAESNPSIFVAMPYYTKDQIQSYNDTYQRIVDKINGENADLNLNLQPIMIHKGGSKDIVFDMFNKIDACSIFIADISQANANVAYELGYARSKNKPIVIVRRKNDKEEVPFDYEHEVRKPYDHEAHSTLEETVYEDIKTILIEMGYSF